MLRIEESNQNLQNQQKYKLESRSTAKLSTVARVVAKSGRRDVVLEEGDAAWPNCVIFDIVRCGWCRVRAVHIQEGQLHLKLRGHGVCLHHSSLRLGIQPEFRSKTRLKVMSSKSQSVQSSLVSFGSYKRTALTDRLVRKKGDGVGN